jgi:hypothetical protein
MHDEDTAALLIFYAAECALKAAYLDKYQLRDTTSATSVAENVRSFGHDLIRLIQALNIPAADVGSIPPMKLRNAGTSVPTSG